MASSFDGVEARGSARERRVEFEPFSRTGPTLRNTTSAAGAIFDGPAGRNDAMMTRPS
jgi:hypothetical protein